MSYLKPALIRLFLNMSLHNKLIPVQSLMAIGYQMHLLVPSVKSSSLTKVFFSQLVILL